MAESKDYNTNFFFPNSAFAKENNRLIAIIVIIWALAVFGFHGWMKVIEKETPEPGHDTYMAAVEALKADTASVQQKQDVAKVYLMLMGKYIALRGDAAFLQTDAKDEDIVKPTTLQNAFTVLANELLSVGQKVNDLLPGKLKKDEEPETTRYKELSDKVAMAVNLKDGKFDAILTTFIPYAVTDVATEKVDYDKMTGIMDKHLIHYRSFLTDTKFLGFPFHYFYSAVFSMVLFCGLCIFYCVVADKMMIRHGIESAE